MLEESAEQVLNAATRLPRRWVVRLKLSRTKGERKNVSIKRTAEILAFIADS